MLTLFIIFATFFFGNLLGYLVHVSLHYKWTGKLHRMHMKHHEELYPHYDYLSISYRNAGSSNSVYIFVPILTVIVFSLLFIFYLLGLNIWLIGLIIVESIIIGWIHNYLHDQFHVTPNWLEKFNFFQKWRYFHYIHHINPKVNYGIFDFLWDKVFGTFQKRH